MTDTYASQAEAIEAAADALWRARKLDDRAHAVGVIADHLSRVAARGDAQPRRIEPPAYHMTNDQYTVDDAIRDAYAWAPDGQTYPSLRGWRVACWLLAKEVDRLRDEVLPDPAKPAEVGEPGHRGTFIWMGDGTVLVESATAEGFPAISLQPGHPPREIGRGDGRGPRMEWTREGEVTIVFKRQESLELLVSLLQPLRAKLQPHPSEPSAVEVTDASRDVMAERQRQQSAEGCTAEHDDDEENHGPDDLALAAICYALPEEYRKLGPLATPELWPWSNYAWNPKDRRRDLVRAGALIIAEIERLDRAALKAQGEGT